MSSLRDIDLSGFSVEQLTQVRDLLLNHLADHLRTTGKPVAALAAPTDIKALVAEKLMSQATTETPSAVNWNSSPVLDAASVVAEAEAIIAGCCPACGSSNVQSSTQNGVSIYTCVDCSHEWEG